MKILCDVCDKDEASVFCVADEAALCAACDHRVHHANKLAGKHQRFSLLHPSPKQAPICDICQERRAFLFCQQDRAILCRECDIPIHKANEHTQKHTRFLLTGVKLSANSTLYSESPSSAESASSPLTNNASDALVSKTIKPQDSKNKPVSTVPTVHGAPPVKSTTPQSSTVTAPESCTEEKSSVQFSNGGNFNGGAISTSSISEYLIEMLPGWHVEDFLDSSTPCRPNFCQGEESDLLPFWDADFQTNMSDFPTENMGFWVPQVQQTQNQSIEMSLGFPNGFRDQNKELVTTNNNIKSSRKRSVDNCFAVPQISPSSIAATKKSRNFW